MPSGYESHDSIAMKPNTNGSDEIDTAAKPEADARKIVPETEADFRRDNTPENKQATARADESDQ
ncbi:MAG: hypothetical protein F6J97_10760 [Leptolyngbya sp. SIO4C1]|nr:hypothetical protein [Leptolyngbya sp. SIO4C1]